MEQRNLNGIVTRNNWKSLLRLFLTCLVIALAAGVFIFFFRAQLNAANRQAAIEQRMKDYHYILDNYIQETDGLLTSLKTDNQALMARQAALFFARDTAHASEEDRLSWIRSTLGTGAVRILSPEEAAEIRTGAEATGDRTSAAVPETPADVACAPLEDGRMIAVSFASGDDQGYARLEELSTSLLLTRLKAGAPGYYIVLYAGEMMVWPRDEQSEGIMALASEILKSRQLDSAKLKAEADRAPNGIAIAQVFSPASGAYPAGFFTVTGAAYAEDTDFVINLTETARMRREGSERTWALIFLVTAVFLFLGWAIGRTDLYRPEFPYADGRRKAFLKCRFLLLMACVTLFVSVLDVQLLSVVNQNAESTVSSVAALRELLSREADRAAMIEQSIDWLYQQRANTAARFLSENPEQVNMDTLLNLDGALGGLRLEVQDLDGRLIASDASFHPGGLSPETEDTKTYRSPLTDADGRTIGFVDFCADLSQASALLKGSTISGVLSSMHILENLEVLAVDSAEKKQIFASSRADWVGLDPDQIGLDTDSLYNLFEGVLRLGGEERYVSVFSWEKDLIVVSCKSASFLDFLGRIALLIGGVILMAVLLYVVVLRQQYALQARGGGLKDEERYPPLRFFMGGFMLSLFVLTVCLFVSSEKDPGGLTYKLVRGQWVRGINPVTFTFIMMMYGVFHAACVLLDLILDRIYRYSSPRSITICQLVKSASHYVAVIALILTTLSMFGVNTGTLLGGAGIVALIFTLGANSLLADVIAGLFLIFDKSFSIGDYVTVDAFSGYIQDISIRSTTIRDPETRNIKIISNATLKNLINRSKVISSVFIDLAICHELGLQEGERIIEDSLPALPARYPQIIGAPRYLGVVSMPQAAGGSFRVRVAFDCQEKDRIPLEYQLQRELLPLADRLLGGRS